MSSSPNLERAPLSRLLTGRDVLVLLALFFIVMFSANIALIYSALHTLHGGELENPYDASQQYNGRIAQARAQAERGWTVNLTTRAEGDGMRVMADLRDRTGVAVPGLVVTAHFEHPFDAKLDRIATLASDGLDYEGLASGLAPGRWTLVLEAKRNGELLFTSDNHMTVAEASD